MARLTDISGIGPALDAKLREIGIGDPAALAAADPARLTALRGVSLARAEAFRTAAAGLTATAPKAR
ncbi:MAG TPA: hypothetical protein DIU07_01440, partial [Rhodobacteraceae bacterium]|nr:hypothetical protein [Paracoccaceae bacterium]